MHVEPGVRGSDSGLRPSDRSWLAAQLAALQERFMHVAGSRTARLAIRLADGRSESPGESVTRVQFYRYDIPMPTLQYQVFDRAGRLVGESDFYWEDFRHLGEFDGFVKYQKLLRPGDRPRTASFARSGVKMPCEPTCAE